MELTPNLTTVIFEVINFVVLAILLYKFFFQPMMRNIEARAAEKEQLLQQIQSDREASDVMRAELDSRLESAEEAAAAIITRAQEQAEETRLALLEEAKEEVEHILVEAHAQAHQMRELALDEFHDELLNAVLETSGLVFSQVATDEIQSAMVKRLTDRIWEMGRSEMQRVETFRLSLGDRVPVAHVLTARPLSSELQGLLVRTFTALADRNVNLDIKVDPALFAGVRVRMGDVVVDNSVAGQLDALHDDVAAMFRGRVADE